MVFGVVWMVRGALLGCVALNLFGCPPAGHGDPPSDDGSTSLDAVAIDTQDATASDRATADGAAPVHRLADGLRNGLSISAGATHACAIKRGQAWCWGKGTLGQLGNGSAADSRSPLLVAALPDALQVSASKNSSGFSCAVRRSGEVSCWGSEQFGKLGNGQFGTGFSPQPVTVFQLTTAVQVSTGAEHACAVKSNGEVVCWGEGAQGKIGNGRTMNSSIPDPVAGLVDAIQVSAGYRHSCAVRMTGEVVCWGYAFNGALGSPPLGTLPSSAIPITVANLSDAIQVATGAEHSCALRRAGSIWCWGGGSLGQLGNGVFVASAVPVQVIGIQDAVQISTGSGHTCALRANGELYCWGYGMNGRLGNGFAIDNDMPQLVLNLSDTEVVSAWAASCAGRSGESFNCWGPGEGGLLGNGATSDSPTPVLVSL